MDHAGVEYAIVCEPTGVLRLVPPGVAPEDYLLEGDHTRCTGHLITFREVDEARDDAERA
jgi:hypothetical protein